VPKDYVLLCAMGSVHQRAVFVVTAGEECGTAEAAKTPGIISFAGTAVVAMSGGVGRKLTEYKRGWGS